MPRVVRPQTVIVGAGRLARALKPLLATHGYRPRTVAARRAGRTAAAPARSVGDAELILLAVPDRAIAEVAGRLAKGIESDWSGRVVLHHAGSLGTEPLAALARKGASVGVLHPLQCFGGGRGSGEFVAGSRARIEGDRRARSVATRLARDLGLVALRFRQPLDAEGRAAYHAAGALVANDLVALVSLALELLESAGLGRRSAMLALGPLVRGTMGQLERSGPVGALTGPVPRGDHETLRGHLARLARISKEDAEIHRLLSRRLARVAAEHGALDAASLRRLLRRIGRGPDREL